MLVVVLVAVDPAMTDVEVTVETTAGGVTDTVVPPDVKVVVLQHISPAV